MWLSRSTDAIEEGELEIPEGKDVEVRRWAQRARHALFPPLGPRLGQALLSVCAPFFQCFLDKTKRHFAKAGGERSQQQQQAQRQVLVAGQLGGHVPAVTSRGREGLPSRAVPRQEAERYHKKGKKLFLRVNAPNHCNPAAPDAAAGRRC
jgi:hypothetical protein